MSQDQNEDQNEEYSDSDTNIQSSSLRADSLPSTAPPFTPTQPIRTKDPYNQPNYKLEANRVSKVYIFNKGLFSRELLLIDLTKNREFLIKCNL